MKRNKTLFNIVAAAGIFLLVKLLFPVVNGITPQGVTVIGMYLALVYLWIFESVSWCSMVMIGLFPLAGVMNYTEVAANSYGSWVVVFIITTCVLNYALTESGITDYIVKWAITRKAFQGRPWKFLIAYFFTVYFISYFIDVNPITLVMLPICLAICEQIGAKPEDMLGKAIYIGTMITILLGYAASPISHTIQITFIGLVNNDFGAGMNFFDWFAFGVPATLAMMLVMLLFIRFVMRPDVSSLKDFDAEKVKKTMVPLGAKQKIIVAAYLTVVFFWLAPTIFENILPGFAGWLTTVGVNVPVVIAIAALLLIRVKGEPVLNFDDASRAIPWPIVNLAAAIMVVNPLISHANSGISAFLTNTIGPLFENASSGFFVVVIAAALVIILTNFMSCFVSGQLVYALFTPLALGLPQLGLNAAAIGVLCAFGCSIAYLTPPASGTSAIFLGTDYARPGAVFRYSGPLMVIFVILTALIMYPIAAAVL